MSINNDIFTPNKDSVRRYQSQLAALLKSNVSKTDTIDMGQLPEIYTMLGIADKQLKTNGKTILKALGIEGRNKHNVPMETVKNLLSLTYDPEAVFKSLSVSNNPEAYIAVLKAKTENQEQIIAILSPSKDGHGFTFIPSVYEKHNFDRFLGRIYEEQKILYVKNKGSEIWGQLQSLPRHKSEPSNINIPTKNDIVNQILKKEQKRQTALYMRSLQDTAELLQLEKQLETETDQEKQNRISQLIDKNFSEINEWQKAKRAAMQKQRESPSRGEPREKSKMAKFEKIPIGKVEKWLVDSAKEVGLDIDGFEHEITNEFVAHVIKQHGDEKSERSRGQIAVREADFAKIPEIVKNPDYAIVGARRKNEDVFVYAKKMEDGTTLYFEEVLRGRTNRTLRGKTMYKRIGGITQKDLKTVVTMNDSTDLSEAKIVVGAGGQSSVEAVKPSSPVVATSTPPIDTLSISQPDEKSSRKSGKSKEENLKAATLKQSESPPLERRNINSKEKFMSDEQNTVEQTFRPPVDSTAELARKEAFMNMQHQRKIVLEGLKNGTLSCLPGEDGFADTQPAVKLVKGENYNGTNLLDLKDHQKKNGFPTAEYVTEFQINEAKKDYPDLSIRQGEGAKGMFIHWEEKNKETGEWERNSVKVFNIAQTTNPEAMKAYAEQKQQADTEKYYNSMKEKYPGWEPKEPKQKGPGPVIECSSTEPEKYLAQYFAAVEMGGKFKASPEQAAEFSQKLEGMLSVLKENDRPDLLVLPKLSNAASKEKDAVIQLVKMEQNKELYKEQHQEQTQSRGGRGM